MANRKIEFRGMRKTDTDRWAYGSSVKIAQYAFIVPSDAFLCEDEYGDLSIKDFVEVIPETVGQYTGLKDEAGVKIFEDDVVSGNERFGFRHNVKGVARYQGLAFSFIGKQGDGSEWFYTITSDFKKDNLIEVIGNIHDTPSLLER